MPSRNSHLTLGLGLLSPYLAAQAGRFAWRVLRRATTDPDSDFVLRFILTGIAMATPFILTLLAFLWEKRAGRMGWPSKAGLLVATLSLGLLYVPITRGITRAQQLSNLAISGQPAPAMRTTDLEGNPHQLSDHAGKVVLVNIWATWCGPCRREMPDLDRLYKERQADGLVVFGVSSEELDVQRKFASEIGVSYPLLTVSGEVPEIFKTSARYPANFVIDRRGMLQPAPSTDQPFENLVAMVDGLLAEPVPSGHVETPAPEAAAGPSG